MSYSFVTFSILCTEENMTELEETLKQVNYNMNECARPNEIIHLVMCDGKVWSFARKYDPCERYTRCSVDELKTYLLEYELES